MAWLVLFLAGVLEVVWALALKHTHGWTRLGPSVVCLVALAASVGLLGHAARTLPIGVAYATWVAIGVVGSTVGGALLFGEPMSAARAVCVGLLLVAVVGLKLTAT